MLTDYERRVIAHMEAVFAAQRRGMSARAMALLRPLLALAVATVAAVVVAGFAVAGLAVAAAL